MTSDSDTSSRIEQILCPICSEPIKTNAKKCKHCGEFIDKSWSGLKGRTLWEWIGLLVIPVSLALIGFGLSIVQEDRSAARESTRLAIETERESTRAAGSERLEGTMEANRSNAIALQAYLDDMSVILLNQDLRDEKVKATIQARTVSVISELDSDRNRTVITFLRGVGLLDWILAGQDLILCELHSVNLSGANLRGALFSGSDMRYAKLHNADLRDSTFAGADLHEANFSYSDLAGANMKNTILSFAHFYQADLSDVAFLEADLYHANLVNAVLTKRKPKIY